MHACFYIDVNVKFENDDPVKSSSLQVWLRSLRVYGGDNGYAWCDVTGVGI